MTQMSMIIIYYKGALRSTGYGTCKYSTEMITFLRENGNKDYK